MNARAKVLMIVFASALGGLLLTSCGGKEDHAAPAQGRAAAAAGEPREVRTAEVVRSGGGGEVALPGVVQAARRAALAARISASVTAVPYQLGQRVPAGAVVVRLDDAALRGALAAAEAGLVAARSDHARTEALLARKAATPRELEDTTARVAAAEAQVAATRDNLAYTALRAPFAGRVSARPVDVGDVVNPGMPLIEIEGEGGLELRASAPAELVAALEPGTEIRAAVDGQPEPLTAKVTVVAPSGDPTTNRVEVKAALPPGAGVRAGSFARLLVPVKGGDARLTVPAAALFERGGLQGVFTVKDGVAWLRWIAVGARSGDLVEVRAGLEPGERVVLEPAGLTDGTPVRDAVAAR